MAVFYSSLLSLILRCNIRRRVDYSNYYLSHSYSLQHSTGQIMKSSLRASVRLSICPHAQVLVC